MAAKLHLQLAPAASTYLTKRARSAKQWSAALVSFNLGPSMQMQLPLCLFLLQLVQVVHASLATVDTNLPAARMVPVRIGAILEEWDHEQANVFIRTIKMINERKEPTIRHLLESSSRPAASASNQTNQTYNNSSSSSNNNNNNNNNQLRFEPMIEFIGNRQSSLEADLKVCQLIESGVLAVLGPLEGASIAHVQSICDNLEIPYFELRPQIGTPSCATAPPTGANAPTLSSSVSPSVGSAVGPGHLASADVLHSWQLTLAQSGLFNKAQQSHPPAGAYAPPNSLAVLAASSERTDPARTVSDTLAGDQTGDNTLSSFERARSPHALANSTSASARQPSQGKGGAGLAPAELAKDAAATNWPPVPLVNARAAISSPGPGAPKFNQHHQLGAGEREDLTLNLYPPAHLLSSAYIDLIYAWNWTSFAIVYDSGKSMIKLQDLLKESSSGSWTNRWQIKLFHFEPGLPAGSSSSLSSAQATPGGSGARTSSTHSFRDIFWRIKSSGEHNILLDVRTENLNDALKQAQQVGCMTEHFSYLITSLDLHTIDLEDFKYSRTRISAFSIVQVTTTAPAGQADQYGERQQPTSSRPAHQQQPFSSSQQNGGQGRIKTGQDRLLFDSEYLEKLGVRSGSSTAAAPTWHSSQLAKQADYRSPAGETANAHLRYGKHKLSPPVVLDRLGGYMEPPSELFRQRDSARREQLASLPASMSILPSLDRNNEQRLFEFFVEQQELYSSRPRLSTSSAILHDSLLLFAHALNELDPSGKLVVGALSGPPIRGRDLEQVDLDEQQAKDRSTSSRQAGKAAECSPDAQPWSLGSSLVSYMRLSSFVGLTGPILFDQRGLRAEFRLELLSMAPNVGLIKVGEWWANRSEQQLAGQFASQQPEAAGLTDQARNYEQLSKGYELELKRYKELLAAGKLVRVPYTRPIRSRLVRDQLQSGGAGPFRPTSGSLLVGEPAGLLQVNDIIFERLFGEQVDQVDTLIVTTKLSQPYFMLKETPNKLEGNDQYEGFAVDLIHELSKLVNFKYRWREVADKKYGSKEVLANGSVVWNGMIGEIIRGQADLAIVDLTITAQREEAVDFTLPFMNTGISILFKKPTTKVTTLFSFLSPFSTDVWAYVLAAYCGISAILYFVGHLSPYEWSQAHLCLHTLRARQSDEEEEEDADTVDCGDKQMDQQSAYRRQLSGESDGGRDDASKRLGKSLADKQQLLHNQFSLLNSFWFTIGSLMQQGSDLTPRSMSTRTIAGIWYFFTLIMISSYTANLAAFLTVEKVVYPIENVRDLSNQLEIRYGCVESGSTCVFFQDSQIDTYKRINENMRKFKTYVRSNDDGQKRVEDGRFAFFMESTSIEYITERNCNLTQIGGLLDTKGYGLATSKKSRFKRPYRTLLSEGILHLQETGMLHMLKNRWWKERRGGGTCTDDAKGGGVTELSLANVGGVFVVLLGGLAISFLVAIAEFMWRARHSGSSRDGVCDQMMSDLKFALACKRSTKPASRALESRARRKRREQQQLADERRRGQIQQQQKQQQQQQRRRPTLQRQQGHESRPVWREACELRRAVSSQQQMSSAPDPVVMHAMLNILMQQQQERNNQPASQVRPTALVDSGRRRLLGGQSQQTTIDDLQAPFASAQGLLHLAADNGARYDK